MDVTHCNSKYKYRCCELEVIQLFVRLQLKRAFNFSIDLTEKIAVHFETLYTDCLLSL